MQTLTFTEEGTYSLNTLLETASLEDMRKALLAQLADSPEKMHLRWRLFQILCLQGEWKRALRQLQTCTILGFISKPTAQALRCLIRAEQQRSAVLAGKSPAKWLEDQCPVWAQDFLEALTVTTKGDIADADMIRTEAFKAVPDMTGKIADQPFTWITDTDTRMGPVFELLIDTELRYVPFHKISHMQWQAPKGLLDLIWTPVVVTLHNGTTLDTYMPARYAVDDSHSDAEKMSRMTSWNTMGETAVIGQGQKVWMTDQGEFSVLTLRHLTMHTTACEG